MPDPNLDVRELTISQIHAAYLAGTYTSHDLTTAYLHRIYTLDLSTSPTPHPIRSTLALSPHALQTAATLDTHLQTHKSLTGPLHGIPILLKDQIDTAGLTTTYGSYAGKGNIPSTDAFIVQKLKAAGAIILGKTSMSEWATSWFSASSATLPPWTFTSNPYSPHPTHPHDVGASSGGSAAAVAANLCVVAVAEDTGGSVRVPASFCNLVGLRCTPGLVSRRGLCPLLKVQDTPGPVARTVEDCARLFDAMVGFDARDEWCGVHLRIPPAARTQKYAEGLGEGFLRGARIGVVRELFGDARDVYCRAVNRVVEGAIERLGERGMVFVDVEIPKLKHYMFTTPTYLQSSRSDINGFLAERPGMPNDIAEIVTPENRPFLALTAGVAAGPLDPCTDPGYAKQLTDQAEFVRVLSKLMYEQSLDALAFPDVQIPPPKHADATNGRFREAWDFPVNTLLASQARWPAITVPAGFTSGLAEQEGDGLPVGIEFVSWELREKELLLIAKGVENVLSARRAPGL
ncbi:putative amidase family protein [Lophiostoma macrostomum CBS 122681]|uniref:Putative amidase family protein n=1 Tax=Lophiostoma macrostomum CBS 122681 TaxID=1314788 RepID=A0A6A6T4W3_9PLEO|nr:putative amidase family protein [Lophiostoma macrostomum CBS 122681]